MLPVLLLHLYIVFNLMLRSGCIGAIVVKSVVKKGVVKSW